MDESTVFNQIAEGSAQALTWLYQTYASDVYRLAYMMTRQSVIAEDLMQDVFLTVIEKADLYKRNISIKAWLLTITRNKTLNFLKHQSRSIPFEEDTLNTSAVSDETDIEFLDILQCLPFTGKQIVLFHIAYGLNHKEISKMLGMSHSAVRKQYERALTVLKTNVSKG